MPVKLKVTIACPKLSVLGFGSVMSVPESAGRSLITNQCAVGSLKLSGAAWPLGPSSTTKVPCGTVMIWLFGGCFWPGSWAKRSSCTSEGPAM